jgi:hypothetical protein
MDCSVSTRILKHFGSAEFKVRVPELAARYASDQFVEIEDFIPRDVFDLARNELLHLYEGASHRRDLVIPSTGNTPRRYSNVDRDTLAEASTVVPAIFQCTTLLARLSEITGTDVLPVPWAPEEYISSRLNQPGDVHGWHWDDYPFALVWLIQGLPPEQGGALEYVKDTAWDKTAPMVERYLAKGTVESRSPKTGSAYLLKADTCLHRVAPVAEGADRIMVCFTFCTLADLDREISHETMEMLYPHAVAAGV